MCVHSPVVCGIVCVWERPGGFNLCTVVFITAWGHSQICLYVCLHMCRAACKSACAWICVCVCQILRMHVLFITFLVCVGKQAEKPKPNRAVRSLLSAARPQAVPDRKLGGLGSKLHLVREENAAFVSCTVCSPCVQWLECVLWSVMAVWHMFFSGLFHWGREQLHCGRLFKGYYRFYLN